MTNSTPTQPVSSINFEYVEERATWVVKAVNMNESEVRDAFMTILFTCQMIKPEHQIHCLVSPTNTPHCYEIRPAVPIPLRELN